MRNDITTDFKHNVNSVRQAKEYYDTHAVSFSEQTEDFLLMVLRRFIKLNSDHNSSPNQRNIDPLVGEISYLRFEIETIRAKQHAALIERTTRDNYVAGAFSAAGTLMAAVIALIALFTK